ncbi:MAG: nucleotidyltransferase [Flavobacteriales bacterium]|nr:nucleotidyltransferase [Flavobacteriales bacterium]
MKIIVPMAGKGSRLRPHTLTVPKPLIPIAGKPIVQRLVEKITNDCGEKVDEIAYIIGDFGKVVENDLIKIAEKLGAKGTIYYQNEALGTAHAINCAKESLKGQIVVAFADTLFVSDFKLDLESDGVIWVKKVEDPTGFGVVKLNDEGNITDFFEKPEEFISDLAIIGIYYFKSGEKLSKEINYILENNIKDKGEFQLTTAMDNMIKKGDKFTLGEVTDWMDCGNKKVAVETNSKVLDYEKDILEIPESAVVENSLVIPPCFIGKDAVIINSKVGPNVSIGKGTKILESNVRYSLIQEKSVLKDANIANSMIGSHAQYFGVARDLSIGDYNILDFKGNEY